MVDKVIYTQFRASDAEQRSYSLRERLNAGKYLFDPDVEDDRQMNTWQQIFWNAVHVVFDNRIFKNQFLTQQTVKRNATAADQAILQDKLKQDFTKSKANRTTLSNLMTAGYWNIFAWLEVLTLFWLNYATATYDPLKDSTLTSFIKGSNIVTASFFYAAARTINLIATPLTIILLASAAAAFGFTPVVLIFFTAAILASIFSVVYHRNQSKLTFDNQSEAFHWRMGLTHFASSLVMGIVQPLVRLYERARDLYHTNPYLFWMGVAVVVIAVCAFAVFPYVGAPAFMGFKLGTFAVQLLNPVLSKLASYFVLNAVQSAVFKSAVAFVATLGVVDLITRGIKEVAGWLNVSRAKDKGAAWEKETAAAQQAEQKAQQVKDAKNKVVQDLDAEFEVLGKRYTDETQKNPSTLVRDIQEFAEKVAQSIDHHQNTGLLTSADAEKIKQYFELKLDNLNKQFYGVTTSASTAPQSALPSSYLPIEKPTSSDASGHPSYKIVCYSYQLNKKADTQEVAVIRQTIGHPSI